jgi:hypothetical protein
VSRPILIALVLCAALLGSAVAALGVGSHDLSVRELWSALAGEPGLARDIVVQVRWPTVTAGQNIHIAQAGCRYAVSVTAVAVPGAGGTGRFDVIQQSDPTECGGPLQNGCIWTAQPDVPWITVTTSMPQAGDNPVSFSVAPNDTGVARSGVIRVRDQEVRITQPSR